MSSSDWNEQQWQQHLTALLASQLEQTKEARAAAYRQFLCDVMAAAKLEGLEINGHRIASYEEDGETIPVTYTEEQRQEMIREMQKSGSYGDEMGLRVMAAALGLNIKITTSDQQMARHNPDVEYRYGLDDAPVMQFNHTMIEHRESGRASPHWQVKQGDEILDVLADGNCLFYAMDLNKLLADGFDQSEYQNLQDAYTRFRAFQTQQDRPAVQSWRGGLRSDNPQRMEIEMRAQSLRDVFQEKLDLGMDINGILNIAESLVENDRTFAETFQRLGITRDEDQNLEELHHKAEQLIENMIALCSVSEEQSAQLQQKLEIEGDRLGP